MRILLVEDDIELGNGVRGALAAHAIQVVWVRQLADALAQVGATPPTRFDLVILDLGLPDGDGLTLVTRLRAQQQTLPVLILTARDALEDRVRGLDGGADDYLVKPFALVELLSRVRALVRRSTGLSGQPLELRGLVLHEPTRQVSVHGNPVALSRSEFALLLVLLQRVGQVVARHVLEDHAVTGQRAIESNVLDVHMYNMRRKLGPGFIRNVRGIGYVIDALGLPDADGAP